MIIDYIIVSTDKGPWEFEKIVKRYVASGWEPQGGMCIDHSTSHVWYFQAMVKRAK
jgi:hypothetical protein